MSALVADQLLPAPPRKAYQAGWCKSAIPITYSVGIASREGMILSVADMISPSAVVVCFW